MASVAAASAALPHEAIAGLCEAVASNGQSGLLVVDVKNRFACGDALELMTPAGNYRFRLGHIESLQGEQRAVAPVLHGQ